MKNQNRKSLNVVVRGVLSRPSLREIYKNAVQCSARHRVFVYFTQTLRYWIMLVNVKTLMRKVF